MKQEDLVTGKRQSRYLNLLLAVLGGAAFLASAWIAWPVLIHLGEKFT